MQIELLADLPWEAAVKSRAAQDAVEDGNWMSYI